MTQPSDAQNNEHKSTEKSSSKIETKNISKTNSTVTISDIVYDENLPTVISKSGQIDLSGKPASDISQTVNESAEIVEVTILDDGRQITLKDSDGGYITSKASVDKVYKGSLNE